MTSGLSNDGQMASASTDLKEMHPTWELHRNGVCLFPVSDWLEKMILGSNFRRNIQSISYNIADNLMQEKIASGNPPLLDISWYPWVENVKVKVQAEESAEGPHAASSCYPRCQQPAFTAHEMSVIIIDGRQETYPPGN